MNPLYLSILFYVIAVLLLLLDLLIPTAGLLLLMSVVSATACVWYGFQSSPTVGMAMLTIVAASIPFLAILALKLWPHTPLGKRIVLTPPPSVAEPKAAEKPLEAYIGRIVVSKYAMMPSNNLAIDGKSLNAVAESGFIDAGQTVEVVAIRERQLVVRATTASPPDRRENPNGESSKGDLLQLPADQLGLDSLQ